MNRRQFISGLVGGIAATAAVRTWPFRVFSFPSEIKLTQPLTAIGAIMEQEAREFHKRRLIAMSENGRLGVTFDNQHVRPTLAEYQDFFKVRKNRLVLADSITGNLDDWILLR